MLQQEPPDGPAADDARPVAGAAVAETVRAPWSDAEAYLPATDLVPGVTNTLGEVYVRDLVNTNSPTRWAMAGLTPSSPPCLRQACPGEHEDHAIELQAAHRLLADRALYARALGHAPAAAKHMITTATR